jgi:hypothetical protein
VYGAAVTGLPTLAPSSWNCTLATPTLLVAFAATVAVPDTVAPFAGAVIDTTGGATALLTVTVLPALVVLIPAVSFAMAFKVCEPLELFAVSQL